MQERGSSQVDIQPHSSFETNFAQFLSGQEMEFHCIKSGLHDNDKQNALVSNYLFDFFNQYKSVGAVRWIFSLIMQHSSLEAKSA